MKKMKQCKICKSYLPNSFFWKYKKPNTRFLENKEFIYYHTCKDCCAKIINLNDPNTFLPILKEMNIPYWEYIYNKYSNTTNQFGRYLARMRLGNLYDLEYKDTKFLNGGFEEDET